MLKINEAIKFKITELIEVCDNWPLIEKSGSKINKATPEKIFKFGVSAL
jgi:hypothetical protein